MSAPRKPKPTPKPKPAPDQKPKQAPRRRRVRPAVVDPPAQPATNGHAPDHGAAADPPEYAEGNSRNVVGRLASTVTCRPVSWFLPDFLPRDCLSFVVGVPGSGKSSFGAWLLGQAKSPAILPGHEESLSVLTVPRMRANNVHLERCLILDGRDWVMPADRAPLTTALRGHGADLLWIDPVDSYVGADAERSGEGVRAALESLHKIAEELKMAVVCVRHPGKATGNLCPGFHQWRDVPRVIIELCKDDGPPLRRFLRRWKDPLGLGRQPREFTLVGDPGEPKRFSLNDGTADADVELMEIPDPIERTMLEQATELLQRLLIKGPLDSIIVRKQAESEGIKEGILRRAGRRLGYKVDRSGVGQEHKSSWSLSDSVTASLRQTHPEWLE